MILSLFNNYFPLGVLTVNGQHLKCIVTNEIEPDLIKSVNLEHPIYCD